MQVTSVNRMLASADAYLKAGDRESAYLMSLEATQLEPNNVHAWMMRYKTALSSEEKLLCLGNFVRLDPDNPLAKRSTYNALLEKLHKDPFLAYIEETEKAYHVYSKDNLFLVIPKDRSIPETYPPKRSKPLLKAYRSLALAVMGLALAGLGTLLFAPNAIRLAFGALFKPVESGDRRRAGMVIILSLFLLVVAVFFGWLFVAHFIG
jgi:hypothetical protein